MKYEEHVDLIFKALKNRQNIEYDVDDLSCFAIGRILIDFNNDYVSLVIDGVRVDLAPIVSVVGDYMHIAEQFITTASAVLEYVTKVKMHWYY